MAFIFKQPKSPFWFVGWRDAEGRQHKKSTHTTNRGEALAIANGTRTAVLLARRGRLTSATARDVVTSIVSDISANWTGAALERYTLRSWSAAWVASKQNEVGPATVSRYTALVKRLCDFAGPAADRDLAAYTIDEATRFRDHLVENLSAGSAKLAVKILKALFSAAAARGLIPDSTVQTLKTPKARSSGVRRAFTDSEIRALLKHAEGEWRGLILFGLFTGQRLGDVRSWTWRHVNLDERIVVFNMAKTDTPHTVALAEPLVDHLATLPAPDSPDAPLFPISSRTAVNTLSKQFYTIMVDAGLVPPRTHEKKKNAKARDTSRTPSPISYHSFRHTLSTWLDATASPAISAKLIGHESQAVHRGYSHLEQSTIREALNNLAKRHQVAAQ